MTRKVSLRLSLVGRSDNGYRVKDVDWTNEEQLETVKSIVGDYFGNRALLIQNEDFIKVSKGEYPEYYCAGWFLSETGVDDSNKSSELVVLAHGKSMESARKAMMDTVRSTDWNAHAVNIL